MKKEETVQGSTAGEGQMAPDEEVISPSKEIVYLNRNQDDEMLVHYYRRHTLKTALTYALMFLTGGILRLVFHWIPYWYLLMTHRRCSTVQQADTLLITEVFKGKYKMYHVRKLRTITGAFSIPIANNRNNNNNSSNSTYSSTTDAFQRIVTQLVTFSLKKVQYYWDDQNGYFRKLAGLEGEQILSSQQLHASRGLTTTEQENRRQLYGPNRIVVPQLSIFRLVLLEVLTPFYVFQLASFTLWFADDYYYYAGAILFISCVVVGCSVRQTRWNQHNLQSTVHSSDVCTVLRPSEEAGDDNGATEVITTENLVPGDVIQVPTHGCVMHCDAVLLTGNCILNESVLTGESAPVTKTAFPQAVPGLAYDVSMHARHTLFCGTRVIQTRYFGNEMVLAVVVRTGYSTTKGNLVRSILYPPPVDYRFEKDSYRFVVLLAFIAAIGFLHTAITKGTRGRSTKDIVMKALDLVTIVVPPALPAAMTVGRFYAQLRLQAKNIFCISPRSINVSGSVDCVCYDKTGTLTEDGLDLLCVVPIEGGQYQSPVNKIDTMPLSNTLLGGLVSCHSLTVIDREILGDPLDLKMFESTRWQLEADSTQFQMIFPTVLKPPAVDQPDVDLINQQIGIIREFPFSSTCQRMGVIVRRLHATHFEYYCKGSPEMLLNFVDTQTVPRDFHEVLNTYAQQGYRVIAIAHKALLKMSYTRVQKVTRDSLETNLTLLGLIVLENRLKDTTKPCIQLLNVAGMRQIMITGDNILTALSVAKECDLIQVENAVVAVDVVPGTMQIRYRHLNNNNQNGYCLNENYRFAITGKVWSTIKEYHPAEVLAKVVTRGVVFARMSPVQKQELVLELQNIGYCVAMCGDGANDCGALKAAHTGISLSEAESSVASPFTSRTPNISCVLDVVREGRAALVTSFGLFKYMAGYSLCQFSSVLILYAIDSNLADFQFLYIDLAIISVLAFFFGRTHAFRGTLVSRPPTSSLISFVPLVSLTVQLLLVICTQFAALYYLRAQQWYQPFNATTSSGDTAAGALVDDDDEPIACLENYVIFSVSSFQYILLALIFSKGAPYRRSIFSNYGLMAASVIFIAFSTYLTVAPHKFFVDLFELVLPAAEDDASFGYKLLFFPLVNCLFSLFMEHVLIDRFLVKMRWYWQQWTKWRTDNKQHQQRSKRRQYLNIERILKSDAKWPPITTAKSSDLSATGTTSTTSSTSAEIVVEKERFGENHVLKQLYEKKPSKVVVPLPEDDDDRNGARVTSGTAQTPPTEICILEMEELSEGHSSHL